MRFIPTMLHGIGDYVFGLIVIGLPFLYGWTGSQRWVLIALGIFLLLYSVCTDYELGAARLLRVEAHMFLDVIFGLLMLILPRLLNFSRDSFAPTSVIGILSLLTILTKIPAQGAADYQTSQRKK